MDQRQAKQESSLRRVGCVDAVKGIAIILMVYGHIAQGGMHRHLWDDMPGWPKAILFGDAFIYSFHMPAFFFAAGLFLAGSAKRHGRPNFILERVKTILYPYVLWTLLSTAVLPISSRFMLYSKPSHWRDILVALGTGNISWFLPTLFACQIFALLVLRLPHWLQMIIAIAAGLLVPVSDITVLFMPFLYFPFVVAGMWFSADRLSVLERLPKRWAAGGFAVLLALQLALIGAFGEVTRWNEVPVGLTGIAMLFFLSSAIRGTITDKWLQWFGEGSLAIFLLSPFFTGAAREFLVRVFHVIHPVPYIAFTTLVSIVVPALIWSRQDQLRMRWMFRWPASKKGSMTSRAQTVTG
ncbi:MAG TPA: acyltransferase [Terracidiphilus sp.]